MIIRINVDGAQLVTIGNEIVDTACGNDAYLIQVLVNALITVAPECMNGATGDLLIDLKSENLIN